MSEILVAAKLECIQVVAAFPYHLDNRDYAGVLSLFAEDGVFERPDVKFSGKSELAAWLESRSPTIQTRHICCSPAFTRLESDEISAVTNFTLYQSSSEGGAVPNLAPPAAIAEYHDAFVREKSGWKFKARRVKIAMLGQ